MSVIFFSDVHIKTADDCQKLYDFIKYAIKEHKAVTRVVMLGDIMDFWFEYRGFVKAEYTPFYMMLNYLKENKISVDYIAGNHDFALEKYFSKNFGVNTYKDTEFFIVQEFGVKILCGHGDRIIKSSGYKYLSSILNLRINQVLFSLVPPWIGEFLSKMISTKSRKRGKKIEEKYTQEFIVYLNKLKTSTVELCKKNGCKFGFVGHTHQNIKDNIDGIIYQNTGSFGFSGDYYVMTNNAEEIILEHFIYIKSQIYTLEYV